MRKHKPIDLPKYGVKYRPLTIGDRTVDDCILEKSGPLYRHQADYVHLMALFASMNEDTSPLQIACPKCQEIVRFNLHKNAIMVEEFEEKLFGDNPKISVKPRTTGSEEIPDLIDFVVIDGDQVLWTDCSDKEKEAVLDSIDYAVYKSIHTALEAPAPVANIPVKCSCGYEHIVSLRGLEAFLKVV